MGGVVMKRFEVEWDDFSGGYYLGIADTKQPKNTWVGDNIGVTPDKGFLVPLAAPTTTDRVTLTALAGDTTRNYLIAQTVDGGGIGAAVVAYGTNTYHSSGAGSGSWTTLAHAGTTAAEARPVEFQSYAVMPSTTTKVILVNLDTVAVTTPTTTAILYTLGTYKEWVVGAAANENRLYFCDVADPTSWPSLNYIDIGSSSSHITTLVDMHDALYVGTTEGWWTVTGALGTTSVVRFLTAGEPGYASPLGGTILYADESDGGESGALTSDATSRRLLALSGATTRPLFLADADDVLVSLAHWGQTAVLAVANGDTTSLLTCCPQMGQGWCRRTAPATPPVGPYISSRAISSSVGYYLTSISSATKIAAFDVFPVNPDSTAGAATVDLADHQANKPFRVMEVIVEVALGTTSTAMTRSVGVSLKCPNGPLDFASGVTTRSANASPIQTQVLPRLASTAGERVVLRFNANLTGDTFSVTPSITLEGCMLRRVVVRCQEVD